MKPEVPKTAPGAHIVSHATLSRAGSVFISRSSNGLAKVIPMLVVALIAAASGVFFALQSSPGNSTGDSDLALNAIQAKLGNSLVLPADFKKIPEFTMLDKNANTVSAETLKGQWNMLFFGFTHCPDVCPMTLSILTDTLKQIESMDEKLPTPNVVFVSVDPKRDTPEGLKNYVEFFNPNFNALTGTLNQMYDLINPLSVVVAYTADVDDENEYTVDHTASILLIDPELRLRGKFNAPHKAQEIAADYRTMLTHLM